MNIEWMSKYFQRDDPVKTIGTYVSLLILRFERKSNYERVLDFEEIIAGSKLTLRELLGPSASAKAYLTGLEFVNELFRKHPEALQAKYRQHLLEYAESVYYPTICRHYFSVLDVEMDKVPYEIRIRIGRVLQDLKYGKIPTIDKTCSGSLYVSKVDLATHVIGRYITSGEIQNIVPHMAKLGIIKPEYMRIIIPAPLLEERNIKKLLSVPNKVAEDLINELSNVLALMGYTITDDTVLIHSTYSLRVVTFEKCRRRLRFRIGIVANTEIILNKELYNKILSLKSQQEHCITFIIVKNTDVDMINRSNGGVAIIQVGDVDKRHLSQYVKQEIVKTLLEISVMENIEYLIKLLENITLQPYEVSSS